MMRLAARPVLALAVFLVLGFAPKESFAKLSQTLAPVGAKSLVNIDDSTGTASTSLTKSALGGWESRQTFGYGTYSVNILVPSGFTAAVVTAFYASASSAPAVGGKHDEIDFELLGNAECKDMVIHTNYYSEGKGSHEEQFKLWFPLCGHYVEFKVVYTSRHIVWVVNRQPIREYVFSSGNAVVAQDLRWNGNVWRAFWASHNAAGALIPVNWNYAPFTAHYRGFAFRQGFVEDEFSGLLQGTKAGFVMKWLRRRNLRYTWTNPTKAPAGGGHHPAGSGHHHHSRRLLEAATEQAAIGGVANPLRITDTDQVLSGEEEIAV